jgi:hypothetical protein
MKQKLFYWLPRALAILAILFMMMFSLDCFSDSWTFGKQILCFLMHNIPAGIVILVLIISWKWELAGGILFLLTAVAGSMYFRGFSGNPGVLIVMLPFVVTGFLFILNHFLFGNKKNNG